MLFEMLSEVLMVVMRLMEVNEDELHSLYTHSRSPHEFACVDMERSCVWSYGAMH